MTDHPQPARPWAHLGGPIERWLVVVAALGVVAVVLVGLLA